MAVTYTIRRRDSRRFTTGGSGVTFLVQSGPRGPVGPAASTVAGYPATVDAAVSGHRLVYRTPAGLAYADPPTAPGLGLTLGAAAAGGTTNVLTAGEVTDPSWNWTPDSLVYAGPGGTLTQTRPTAGVLRVVGRAVTATKLFFDPTSAPITLA